MKEPSLSDVFAGIGTAILAAAVMLMVVLVPFLLFMDIVEQGAGRIVAAVLIAAGALFLAVRLTRRRQREFAQRRP